MVPLHRRRRVGVARSTSGHGRRLQRPLLGGGQRHGPHRAVGSEPVAPASLLLEHLRHVVDPATAAAAGVRGHCAARVVFVVGADGTQDYRTEVVRTYMMNC